LKNLAGENGKIRRIDIMSFSKKGDNASLNEYAELCKRWADYYEKNGVHPNYGTLNEIKILPEEMLDSGVRVGRYLYNNKYKLPGTVRVGVKDEPSPIPIWDGIYREQKHTMLRQPDKYSCGSNTAANIISTWGIQTSDKEMRKYCKTGTHGTNPGDLVNGILNKLKDSGFTQRWCDTHNSKDLGSNNDQIMNWVGQRISSPDLAIAVLVNTGPWDQYYDGTYEHWVMPIEINTKKRTVLVNDPARTGYLTFSYDGFMAGVRAVSRKSWYVFGALK
jgi:hypothetical protein